MTLDCPLPARSPPDKKSAMTFVPIVTGLHFSHQTENREVEKEFMLYLLGLPQEHFRVFHNSPGTKGTTP